MMYQKRTPANDHSTRSTNQRRLCRNQFTTRAPRIPINHLLSAYFQIGIKVPFFLELQKWNYSWFFSSLCGNQKSLKPVDGDTRLLPPRTPGTWDRPTDRNKWFGNMYVIFPFLVSFKFCCFFLLRNSSKVLIGESESDYYVWLLPFP